MAAMKKSLAALLVAAAGCALVPSWHWEKPGASQDEYDADLIHCKAASYSGTSGMVTQEMVRRMHYCMEALGWRKAEN